MTAARTPLATNRSVLGLLRVPAGDGPQLAASAANRLRRLYAPVLADCAVHVRWHEAARAALVLVTEGAADPGDRGVWGAPAGPGPRTGGGPWVRWDLDEHALRLTTSGNAVATLRRATAGGATAWATRSLAAHALVGARPVVRRDVVPEYVLLDCTTGDDDLLDGTTRLPDASVVTASRDGVALTRWADDADRYSPGPPTSGTALRTAALDAAQVLSGVPGTALGLTAGRDSGLLAAAVVIAGSPPPAFTMGWPGLPDVDGAVHRAAALGLEHRTLPLRDWRGRDLDSAAAVASALRGRHRAAELLEVVRTRTRWSDGNEVPRNALLGDVRAPGRAAVWLSGSGGELARALYWHDGPPGAAPAEVLLAPRTGGLADAAAADLAARVHTELAVAASWGRTGRSGLDVLYLRSRMRNWLGNLAPLAAFEGFVPGLLEPATVRVLLDVPEEQRRTGSLFAEVTEALLHEAAGRPVGGPPAAPSGGRPRRLAALRRRADALSDWRLLDGLLRHLDRHGPGLARDVLGERWWATARTQAPGRPYVRQWLWNAVAVDALALVADEVATTGA